MVLGAGRRLRRLIHCNTGPHTFAGVRSTSFLTHDVREENELASDMPT